MDISIEDEELTLTMVDPMFGESGLGETHSQGTAHVFESLFSPAAANARVGSNGENKDSNTVEDNREEILKSLKEAFAEVTSVADLQSFLHMYTRVRVMVSIYKLLELHGDKCMETDGKAICGRKLAYQAFSCGSRVEIVWKCSEGHTQKWESSEILTVKNNSSVYLNESLQSAAIIISGNNYRKCSLLAKALNLNLISSSTFLRFQEHCAAPVVKGVWAEMNRVITEILKKYDEICLCGDGRNDSPGHYARYCVYTLMEHVTKVIVDFEVLDSRETGGNSVTMEREGLRRLLERLASSLPFSEFVSDASQTIIKLVREIKGMEVFHYLS